MDVIVLIIAVLTWKRFGYLRHSEPWFIPSYFEEYYNTLCEKLKLRTVRASGVTNTIYIFMRSFPKKVFKGYIAAKI